MKEAESLKERQQAFVRGTRRDSTHHDIAQLRLGPLEGESVGRLKLTHLQEYREEALVRRIVEWLREPVDPANFYSNLRDIESGDTYRVHQGVIALRKVLTNEPARYIQPIIDQNALPRLIALAQETTSPHLQLEASWCLTNLLSGTTAQTAFLVKKNIVPIFVEVALSAYPQIAEQAVWGIGNVAADCLEFRQLLVQAGAIPALCTAFDRAEGYLQGFITWAFSNICKNSPEHEPNAVVEGALQRMVQFVARGQARNPEDLQNCLFGISRRVNKHNVELVAQPEFLTQLRGCYPALLAQPDGAEAVSLVHQIFGSLTSGQNAYADHLMDAALFEQFREVLAGNAPLALKKEVCWVLANVALCDHRHVLFLLAAPGVLDAVAALAFHAEDDMAKEALYVLCNLSKVSDAETLQRILARGLLDIYTRVLGGCEDARVLLVLESLFQLLKTFRGLGPQFPALVQQLLDLGVGDLLEHHQRSQSDLIYFKARIVLENFFELE